MILLQGYFSNKLLNKYLDRVIEKNNSIALVCGDTDDDIGVSIDAEDLIISLI